MPTTPTPTIPAASEQDAAQPDSVAPVQAYRSAQFLQQLEAEIRIRRDELEALERARDVLLGTPRGALISRHATAATEPTTIADAVEQILVGCDALHVSEIREQLKARFSMEVTPKNLANTLNRWISRGSRFKRPRINTFALAPANSRAHGSGHKRSA